MVCYSREYNYWFIGIVSHVAEDSDDVQMTFLEQDAPGVNYFCNKNDFSRVTFITQLL